MFLTKWFKKKKPHELHIEELKQCIVELDDIEKGLLEIQENYIRASNDIKVRLDFFKNGIDTLNGMSTSEDLEKYKNEVCDIQIVSDVLNKETKEKNQIYIDRYKELENKIIFLLKKE